MLEEVDKQRIHLEEVYRHEVRQQLAERTERQSSLVWKFLNSAFGIWLLSTVGVSGLGALFTKHSDNVATATKNSELIERLDFEISYRLSHVLQRLYDLTDKTDHQKLASDHTTQEVTQTLRLLSETSSDRFPSLYSEFTTLGLPVLMEKLRRIVPDDKRHALEIAIVAATGNGFASESELSDVALIAGRIIEKLVEVRPDWRGSWFPFIDCPKESPFCRADDLRTKAKALHPTRWGSGVALLTAAWPELSRPMLPVACCVGSPHGPRQLLV